MTNGIQDAAGVIDVAAQVVKLRKPCTVPPHQREPVGIGKLRAIFPHHENMQPIALLQSRFNQIKVAERKRIGVEHN